MIIALNFTLVQEEMRGNQNCKDLIKRGFVIILLIMSYLCFCFFDIPSWNLCYTYILYLKVVISWLPILLFCFFVCHLQNLNYYERSEDIFISVDDERHLVWGPILERMALVSKVTKSLDSTPNISMFFFVCFLILHY